jgi:hypothetical protein
MIATMVFYVVWVANSRLKPIKHDNGPEQILIGSYFGFEFTLPLEGCKQENENSSFYPSIRL